MKKIYRIRTFDLFLLVAFILTTISAIGQTAGHPGGVTGAEIWLNPNTIRTVGPSATSFVTEWRNDPLLNRNSVVFNKTTVVNLSKKDASIFRGSPNLSFNSAVRFKGKDDHLGSTTGLTVNATDLTVVLVLYDMLKGVDTNMTLNMGFGSTDITTGKARFPAIGGSFATDGKRRGYVVHGSPSNPSSRVLGGTSSQYGFSANIQVTTIEHSLSSRPIKHYFNGSSAHTLSHKDETMKTITGTMQTRNGVLVGGGERNATLNGLIAEVLVFKSALSLDQRKSVENYLGIKYGVSLESGLFTSADKNTVFWNPTIAGAYKYNVAGIARDDGFINKSIGRSSRDMSVITVSTKGSVYEAGRDITTSVALANNKSGIFWGTNEEGFSNPQADATNGCGYDSTLGNRFWKFRKTNLGSTELEVRAGGNSFAFKGKGFDVYMLIAKTEADAKIGRWVSVIPGTYLGGTLAEHSFPVTMDSDEMFVSFGASIKALQGDSCKFTETGYLELSNNEWRRKAVDKNLIASNGAKVNFKYRLYENGVSTSNNMSYVYPSVNYSSSGILISKYWSDRHLHSKQKAVMEVTFPDGPILAKFNLYGIDKAQYNSDKVKVIGYLNGAIVMPVISKSLGSKGTYYTINGNELEGVRYNDWNERKSEARVEFKFPVDKIEIIHEIKTVSSKYESQKIGYGNFEIRCPKGGKPNDDGLELTTEAPIKVTQCEEVVYRFNLNNYACYDREVNFENQLPQGMVWNAESILANEHTLSGAVLNNYADNRMLSIGKIKLKPREKVTIEVTARFEDGAVSGTYSSQAKLSYKGGLGNTDKVQLSCDERTSASCLPTKVVLEVSNVNVLPPQVSFEPLSLECYEAGSKILLHGKVKNPNQAFDYTDMNIALEYGEEMIFKDLIAGGSPGQTVIQENGVYMLFDVSIPRNSELNLTYELEVKDLLTLAKNISGDTYTTPKDIPREVLQQIADLNAMLSVNGSSADACINESLSEVSVSIEPDLILCNKLDKSCYYPAIIGGLTKNNSDFVMMTSLDRTKDGDLAVDDINALLYLESKSKGFVITRMSTPQILALVEPVAGMLVYDLTEKCLKLYDGVQWSCLVQSCPDA